MAKNHAAHATGDDDLDALIGELRREAARRRAEPSFPVDEEAALGMQLDGHAPHGSLGRLTQLADAIDTLRRQADGPLAGSAKTGPFGIRRAASPDWHRWQESLTALIRLAAASIRQCAARFADVERRLAIVEPGGAAGRGRPCGTVAVGVTDDEVAGWLLGVAPPGDRRVLYCGAEAEEAVATLRQASVDAYGVTLGGEPFLTHPDLHAGDLAEHLRSVGDGALGAVIAAGVVLAAGPGYLADLAVELSRVTGEVAVISVAPWAWREQVGPEHADLAPARPLSAETWLAALSRAGFTASATYARDGTRYRVLATRAGAALPPPA